MCSADCDRSAEVKGLCRRHYEEKRRRGRGAPVRSWAELGECRTYSGYVYVKVAADYVGGNNGGWVREHRLVMERMLGRTLRPGENVHHMNGNRLDNRPENLELWAIQQPSGQRVSDIVATAQHTVDDHVVAGWPALSDRLAV